MFTRAFSHNDETVFYFDQYDNKYVAKGGSLAWRINNPGLVHSYSRVASTHHSIGSHGLLTIFPNPIQGVLTLVDWLHCQKYFNSTLKTIAKHYQPEHPDKFLKGLCRLTSLNDEVKLSSLTKKEFDLLVWGIKKMVGFNSTGDEELHLLPKIVARFYSNSTNIESYLLSSDQFVSKQEVIHWVEAQKLDAVIVHKRNGTVYLRSRPGHHLEKIRFSEKEYGKDYEFEEIVRDVGEKKPGQCIWAFVNGVKNTKENARESALGISSYVSNEQVWSLINDTKLLGAIDVTESIIFKVGIETPIVKQATKFLKFLLKLSAEDSKKPPVIVIAHSQGAVICDLALTHLNKSERQQFRIFTFGGWSFIPPEKCHIESHNFISPYDIIPRVGSPNVSMLLLRIYQGCQRGLSKNAVIDEMVEEDVDYYLDTLDPSTREKFKNQRKMHYQKILENFSNVTILDDFVEGPWEHSFFSPCYQTKLKNILMRYKK